MNSFLETYGKAIFTLVIITILIAFAGPLGIKIKNTTTDKVSQTEQIGKDEIQNSVNSKEETKGEAFAVYSADDNSISFYKRETLPNIGEEFEGKTVTKIYTGIETTQYNNNDTPGLINDIEDYYSYYIVDEIKPISTVGFLSYAKEIHNIENLDTSNVTDMSYMFLTTTLTTLDLSTFDTSNVTDMNSMFFGCNSLVNLDLSSFDTSNVTNMQEMFRSCTSLTSIDLSNFNTSKVTNMCKMFYECTSLTSIDLSNFDTSNVTDMKQMFCECTSLTSIDLINFTINISNEDNIYDMFWNCKSLSDNGIKLNRKSFDKLFEIASYNINTLKYKLGVTIFKIDIID